MSIIRGTNTLRETLNRLNPIKQPNAVGIDDTIMKDWDFNILNHFKTHSDPFCSISHILLNEFFNFTKLDPNISAYFLRLVEHLYNDTSYHNKMHGLMVAQKMTCLANYINIFDKMSILDRASFIVAGLCHDIAHPGRTNSFYINSLDKVSAMFNGKAVLENYHAACTFNILEMPEANIFQNLSKKDFNYCRSKIVSLILATDTSDHFEFISNFRQIHLTSNEYDRLNTTEKLIIKAADISSSVVSWDESLEWIQRLLYEFYSQGDEEIRLGLPITPQCDPSMHDQVYKNQVYFIKSLVIPLYEHLDYLDNDDKIRTKCIYNVNINLSNWESGYRVSLPKEGYKSYSAIDLNLLY